MALAKAGFTLGVRPVGSLLPHEETIPSHVERIAKEMVRDKVQKDPIIIDSETATVLDGMHRLAAFASMKIENAVCCSVDYSSKSVSLARWARVYTLSRGDAFKDFIDPSGMSRRATLAEAFRALETKDESLAVLTPDSAYLPQSSMDFQTATATIRALDRLAEVRNCARTFVPEDDVDVPLQSERNFVVLLRRLGKDDVVTAARSGRLFPCKTSMHRVDPRPVAVDFPLDRLNDANSAILREKLAGRGETVLPPDSLYEGRRYKERLLLLDRR